MKILLIAINARYTHSNLAVHSLKAYAEYYFKHIPYVGTKPASHKPEIIIREFTINQQLDTILSSIHQEKAEIICFSCYIWNISMIRQLITTIGLISPQIPIWLGGPEVSYQVDVFLETYPNVREVVSGAGEFEFVELICEYMEQHSLNHHDIREGISTDPKDQLSLANLPFPYTDLEAFANRIIYYESSKGCPYQCSYCLSSIDHTVEFRDLSLVKKELQFFLDARVKQVKFVDRTFNCKHSHSMAIWLYIHEHDNGYTNFHFEIKADLLQEDELMLLSHMRPHLVQFEIGVQSTNPKTLQEIKRYTDFSKLQYAVRTLQQANNIHLHLDLIAGLPYEDLSSFQQSFHEVMNLRPNQLQLGFLKVLSGSPMERKKEEYQLLHRSYAPYEVLQNKWITYDELMELKAVEDVVEIYYNSEMFQKSISFLQTFYEDSYQFFHDLGRYYGSQIPTGTAISRSTSYEILLPYAYEVIRQYAYPEESMIHALQQDFLEGLIHDYYRKDHAKTRPSWAGEDRVLKDEKRDFYDRECEALKLGTSSLLQGYYKYEKRQIRNMTHMERFKDGLYLFDYLNKEAYSGQARILLIGS